MKLSTSLYQDIGQNPWWEVSIPDPEFCTGESIADILAFMLTDVKAEVVVCTDMSGFRELFSGSSINEDLLVVDVDNFLEPLRQINQLCWSDFFFCANAESASSITRTERMAASIVKSSMTFRTVDQSYFYIYTQHEELVGKLRQSYTDVEATRQDIFRVVFPN